MSGWLVVPTLTADGEPRHIIGQRDGAPLCGAEVTNGEQWPPSDHRRGRLCPRCLQRYATRLHGRASWEEGTDGSRKT